MRRNGWLSGLRGILTLIPSVALLTAAVAGSPEPIPSSAASAEALMITATTAAPLQPDHSLVPATLARRHAAPQVRVSDAYGRLPLYFEANRGQTDSRVKFLSRGTRHALFLTPTEAVVVLTKPEPTVIGKPETPAQTDGTVVRMTFLHANPQPQVAGQEELPGKANYFIGTHPGQWRSNVPTYTRVQYQDIYPGIDLVYYGQHRQLEYDFVVRPGADPRAIVLAFQGADRLEVDAHGDLVLHTGAGVMRQRKPIIYQEVDGVRKEIAGGYLIKDPQQVAFQVAPYDTTRSLVIDPVLFYSTYLGGSGNEHADALFNEPPLPAGVAVDAGGNVYVVGVTTSIDFPATLGAFQASIAGFLDVFVAKLNPTGSGLIYATYLGGTNNDGLGASIAIDAAGNAYVTGHTHSADFPTTSGAFQTLYGGGRDAFVAKLNPTGSGLVYSTYLGGFSHESGLGLALDSVGNAYVTGVTASANFPTTPGAFQTAFGGSGDGDAFVTKLSAAGSALLYSTFLGGTGPDTGRAIALDTAGNAYVTGITLSMDFPTTLGVFQPVFGGDHDAFVTKVNPFGSGLVYSTYLHGSFRDWGLGIAVDGSASAYVTGLASPGFPTTPGAFKPGTSTADAFVTKLDATGSALVYSTLLGGNMGGGFGDIGMGIAVDGAGHAYVTGLTPATDFPTTPDAFQAALAGDFDAFVTKVNPTGTGLVYSSYFGGAGFDQGSGIALDSLPSPNAYVTGVTGSTDLPTTAGAFQTTFGGGTSDAFVARIAQTVLPQLPTEGKVTGGGSIEVTDGIGTFGFIVQRQTIDAAIHGQLQYVNHVSGARVHSETFATFLIAGNTATFGGTCTNNGAPCTFAVEVTDNGEPGAEDSFTIAVSAGPTEGGTLQSGNVQIHE